MTLLAPRLPGADNLVPPTEAPLVAEGEPFHAQAAVIEGQTPLEVTQIETIEPPFTAPEVPTQLLVRSRSLRDLAAEDANRLEARITGLQTELKQIRAELSDPLAVNLLHSSDTERTIMRAAIGNITESIAAATRARKAALRRAGQRIGMAALSE